MSEMHFLDSMEEHASRDAGLFQLEALASYEGGELVTTAATRTTRRIEVRGKHYYLKVQDLRRRRLPFKKWVSYAVQGSPVTREARGMSTLRDIGVKTPELIASGVSKGLFFPMIAALITREVQGYIDLVLYLEREQDAKKCRRSIEAAEKLAARVHDAGYVLLGAKYRNILVPENGAYVPEDLYVVDQPGFHKSRSRRLRARDMKLLEIDRKRYGRQG